VKVGPMTHLRPKQHRWPTRRKGGSSRATDGGPRLEATGGEAHRAAARPGEPFPRMRLPGIVGTAAGGYVAFLVIVLIFHVWLAEEPDAFAGAVWGGVFLSGIALVVAWGLVAPRTAKPAALARPICTGRGKGSRLRGGSRTRRAARHPGQPPRAPG
jgi:hypothetical protein